MPDKWQYPMAVNDPAKQVWQPGNCRRRASRSFLSPSSTACCSWAMIRLWWSAEFTQNDMMWLSLDAHCTSTWNTFRPSWNILHVVPVKIEWLNMLKSHQLSPILLLTSIHARGWTRPRTNTPNTSKYPIYRLQNEEIKFYTCHGFLGGSGNLIQ